MAIQKAVYVWRGDLGNPEGHYSKSVVSDVKDIPSAVALHDTLVTHSKASKVKLGFSTSYIYDDEEPGLDANVDKKAIYYMREIATGKMISLTIPAPVDADIEDTPQGERVTAAALAAVTAAINLATEKVFAGLYGIVIQKR